MIHLLLAALLVQPWHGEDLPTATQAAAKYRVTLSGAPGATVDLSAEGVAKGWIGAFCDMRVCSPNRVSETLPPNGRVTLQFELIREEDGAPKHSGARIQASDGSSVTIP